MNRTYLAPEAYAYPRGGQTRPCRAIYPDGVVRRVWGGIPDTMFSIPAHGRLRGRYLGGWLYVEDDHDSPNYGELMFRPARRYRVINPNPREHRWPIGPVRHDADQQCLMFGTRRGGEGP